MRMTISCFYGGSSYTPQERDIQRGLNILVGTPGRIIDHIQVPSHSYTRRGGEEMG